MVVLAQDSPSDESASESRLNMTVITATAVLQNDRETIQQLRNAGFTSEEIEGIRSMVVARDASSYSGTVAGSSGGQVSFFCPCDSGDASNVIFQTGLGHITVLHEYTSGFRVNVGTMTCPSHAIFCVWSASSQRPGLSPSWFVVHHQSYAHRIHSWCG